MRFLNLALLTIMSTIMAAGQVLADGFVWHVVQNTMWDQRWAPAYTLLPGGRTALITGGYSFAGGGCVNTADIFDEATQKFTRCRDHLDVPRDFAVATPLPDEDVLISGGFNDVFGSVSLAELYHPDNQTFTLIPQHMLSPRELHTATLLKNGEVLIVGGLDLGIRRTQNTAELYDPKTNSFRSTKGNMINDRFGHAACLLADGRVLVVGGTSVLFGRGGYSKVLSTAEIYDPTTEMFTQTTSPMTIGRDRPTATLLSGGAVLVVGGQGPGGTSIDYAELYDPKSDSFSKVSCPQNMPRMAHCASLLPNGDIVLTGGWSAPSKATTPVVEEFNPNNQQFVLEKPLPFSSHDAAQIVFPDGELLVAGGKTVASSGAADGLDSGAWTKL